MYFVWVIKHKPSGVYRFYRTHNSAKKAEEILLEFLEFACQKLTTKKTKTPSEKIREFVRTWCIGDRSKLEFRVKLLLKTSSLREVIVAMNTYVRRWGYDKCLTKFGISERLRHLA